MKIYYGVIDNSIDVTNICIEKLMQNNMIIIPSGDLNRASYFTDPLFGIHKKIIIEDNGIINEYDEFTQIQINIINNNDKISTIHSKLKINHGSLYDELPEQRMVVNYLTGTEKVLEIGGNIGRNSLVIASILIDNNFVTLESDVDIAKQLTENRDLNNFNFYIENSALSNRKLIQKGWDTIPCDSDILQEGYNWVKTITLDSLKKKYNIEFDTLVLDCEGAFYYILMDMPELLNNINLIIMENDYWDISHKNYIDEVLVKNNFYRDYVEPGGWGPCYNNFFEVWKKTCT
jgi:FkbM family methyltransferase